MTKLTRLGRRRVRKPPAPIHWVPICYALYMAGFMQSFSKAECFRMNKRLKEGIKEGRCVKMAKGEYLVVTHE